MNCKLAIVILNYNDADTTLKLLTKIESYNLIKHIVVVDNCSTDNSFALLTKHKSSKVDVIRSDKNGGYGYGNNYGINYLHKAYNPSHILIANPDIQIEEDVLRRMMEVFEKDPKVAVVAPFMRNRDGKKEPGTAWRVPSKYQYIFSGGLFIGHFLKPTFYPGLDKVKDESMEVDCVAGSLLMVDKSFMLRYGMYDENVFLFGEETTIGIKFKNAGLKTILLLQDTFLHIHGLSINKSFQSEIKKQKLIHRSRLYILKAYLGATNIDIVLARMVYGFSELELRLLLLLRRIKNR